MKKLMVMIGAAAAAFGLYADSTFSGYGNSFDPLDSGVSETTLTLETAGFSGLSDATLPLSTYGSGEKYAYDETLVAGNARRTDAFKSTSDTQYLGLETGSSATLTHSIADTGIFVDQLVKFTGFEDPQTNLVAGTKIAVWMSEFWNEADTEATTNLYVTVGKVAEETEQIALKIDDTYKLDQWYRLTIKSLGNVMDSAYDARAGFIIYVDGVQIKSSDEDAKSLVTSANLKDDDTRAIMAAGKLFLSIDASATLQTVGYNGIGAIDDVVYDNLGPVFARYADVTFAPVTGGVITQVVDSVGSVFTDFSKAIHVKQGNLTVYLKAAPGYILKDSGKVKTVQNVTADGQIEVTLDDGDYELAAAMKVNKDDLTVTNYYATAELYGAIAEVQNGDTVTFLLSSDIVDSEENTLYSFTKGTTIAVAADGIWTVNVATYENECYLVNNIGALSGKTITATLADAAKGYVQLNGTVNAGASITVIGGKVTVPYVDGSSDVTVTGTLKCEAIELGSDGGDTPAYAKIGLVDNGSFICTNGTLTADNFTLSAGKQLSITGPDSDGYYTYSILQNTGFAIIIAGEPVYFTTLQDAIDAAGVGEYAEYTTVTITKDMTALTERFDVAAGTKTITIDLNGKTLGRTTDLVDGTYSGNGSVFNFVSGTITLKGGTIDLLALTQTVDQSKTFPTGSTTPFCECDAITVRSGANLTLEGMTILVNNITGCCVYPFNGGYVSIVSGTYENQTTEAYPFAPVGTSITAMVVNQFNATPQSLVISGGKFKGQNPATGDDSGAVTSFIAKGKATSLVDGYWQVVVAVAEIGDKGYATLAEAVDAATAGQTVTLLADTTLDATLAVDEEITVDFGNYTVNLAAEGHGVVVSANATLQNGKLVSTRTTQSPNNYANGVIAIKNVATSAVYSNLVVTATKYRQGLYCDYGTVENEYETIYKNDPTWEVKCYNVDITGGGTQFIAEWTKLTLDADCSAAAGTDAFSYQAAVYSASHAIVTIEGGEYSNSLALLSGNLGGEIIVNGGTFTGNIKSWMQTGLSGRSAYDNLDSYKAKFTFNDGTYTGNITFQDESAAARALDVFKKGTDVVLAAPTGFGWSDAESGLVTLGKEYSADVYIDETKTALTAKLGSGNHIYPLGQSVSASQKGVWAKDLPGYTDKTYYVSAIELYGDETKTFTFEYDGTTLTQKTGETVTITDNVISYNVTTTTQTNPFAKITLTEYVAKYTVTVADGIVNGTVETSVTNDVVAGTTVTITATPATDYEIDKVYTNGVELAAVESVYSFIMPGENVVVSATFKEVEKGFKITISWSDENVKGATYSIDGGTAVEAVSGAEITVTGTMIQVYPFVTDWYKASITNGTPYYAAADIVLTATKINPSSDVENAKSIDEAAEAAGIAKSTAETFAPSGATDAVQRQCLSKVVTWATDTTKGNKSPSVVASSIKFDSNGNPDTTQTAAIQQTTKAYLFNVADSEAAVKAAEDGFKFTSITPGTAPTPTTTVTPNGTVTVQGKANIGDATWLNPTDEGYSNAKFYRAVLTR